MKLAECRNLKAGDPVKWSLGNGWWQNGKFKGMNQVTTYGMMTLADLMTGTMIMEKGRTEWHACVEYVDDRGKTKTTYIRPRKLQRG